MFPVVCKVCNVPVPGSPFEDETMANLYRNAFGYVEDVCEVCRIVGKLA